MREIERDRDRDKETDRDRGGETETNRDKQTETVISSAPRLKNSSDELHISGTFARLFYSFLIASV